MGLSIQRQRFGGTITDISAGIFSLLIEVWTATSAQEDPMA
jgi:hypothetical protein